MPKPSRYARDRSESPDTPVPEAEDLYDLASWDLPGRIARWTKRRR